MPARAPASIDMLHTVMRPSMERERMAEPRYSIMWPMPPPVPMRPRMARITSLAVLPSGSVPLSGFVSEAIPALPEANPQVAAFDELRDDVGQAVAGAADVVDRDDAGMAQLREHLYLPREAFAVGGAGEAPKCD